MKKLIALTMLLTYFLCGCGGSGAAPTLKKAFINPSDAILPIADSYDLRIAVTEDTNPITSIAYQNTQPGDIIAWPGRTRDLGFGNWPAILAEVAKYPRMKYIYLYDELGLGEGGNLFDLSDQTAVLAASSQARAQGLKTIVTYIPHAILNPAFTLGIVNGVDIIAVDIYPNVPIGISVPAVYGNPYKDYLLACITKLRAMGFSGEIWYIYQAFNITTNDPVWFQAELVKQRAAIDDALGIGAAGVIPFGLYLGAAELSREPNLVPLMNTEPLVIP